MPIFDQGYRHWDGARTGLAGRPLAIARQGVRAGWAKKGAKQMVVAALAPALALAAILVLWALLEQKSSLIMPLVQLMRDLPESLREGPRQFRPAIWTLAFNQFLEVQLFFSMLLVLIVGPDLISQDLRFNAMPLYFSRPLRRVDYFLGKLGVIAAFLGAVTVLPILVAYLLGVGFSLDLDIFRDTGRVLAASLAYSLIVVASAGTLMLALSSLSRNARHVSGLWFGVWVVSKIVAGALFGAIRADWCPLVSYTYNLKRLRQALLDTDAAWTTLAGAFEGTPLAARLDGPSAAPQPPWEWSAGVLVGLFALSALILSTRVKSLDRLK